MVESSGWGRKLFICTNYGVLALLGIVCLAPFLHVGAVSFSDHLAVVSGQVSLMPVRFTTEPYTRVFYDDSFLRAFALTVCRTGIGTLLNLALTIITAYALSKPFVKGRSTILLLILFTSVFSGGMIPHYMNIRNLGLLDHFLVFLLPGAISTFNLIIAKSYMETLPSDMEESAKIDGASVLQTIVRIIVPLSLPVIATLALFYAVQHWNSYLDGILYVNNLSLRPLQVVLRNIIYLNDPNAMIQYDYETSLVASESIKGAAIMTATLPILLLYPFLQKYFVQGITLGAVKG